MRGGRRNRSRHFHLPYPWLLLAGTFGLILFDYPHMSAIALSAGLALSYFA
jgi:hypothetical protein